MVFFKTICQYLLVIFCILVINFALPRLAPGNPAIYLVGGLDAQIMSEEELRAVLHEYKLDLPVITQFKNYIIGIAKGDLGISVTYSRPVADILKERLPWTLLLMGVSVLLSTIIGVVIGVIGALRRGGKKDLASLFVVMIFSSLPPFWLAMLMITFFSAGLGWFPAFGAYSIFAAPGTPGYYIEVLKHLVLPAATLTLVKTGSVYLTTRSAMVIAMEEDYILLAHAKGLNERVIVFKHALRNAILPVYTNLMIGLGAMLGGAVVIETVFSYPGIGYSIFKSVDVRDYNLLQGCFLVASMSVVICNMVADLVYPLLDPRVRKQVA